MSRTYDRTYCLYRQTGTDKLTLVRTFKYQGAMVKYISKHDDTFWLNIQTPKMSVWQRVTVQEGGPVKRVRFSKPSPVPTDDSGELLEIQGRGV